MHAKTTMYPPADPLSVAVRVFAFHECLKLLYGTGLIFGAPQITAWHVLCTVALAVMAYQPSVGACAVALSLRLIDTIMLMPFCWDSFYWCFQIDGAGLAFILTLSSSLSRGDIAHLWSQTARIQLALFYLAAAYWKINPSFLDPATSCSTIFFLTLLPTLGLTPSPTLAALIRDTAPLLTILGEASIGLLLLAPSTKLQRLGVVVALSLHLGIALTPSPNNATPFSLACVVRLLITESHGFALALYPVEKSKLYTTCAVAAVAAAVSAGVVYNRAMFFSVTPVSVDWWVAAYSALSVFCLRAVAETEFSSEPSAAAKSATPPPIAGSIRRASVALAAAYAFVFPALGLQDLGASNMYSNLLMHGKGNHYLSPTDLMAHAFPDAFATVRVEASTSAWMNSIYPGEITQHMAPYEVELLRSVGHTGRMFNAMKNRILGTAMEVPFVRYTVPALEMRRLLAEARAKNESFSLTYTHLEGTGDERWRRTASGRTVTLYEDGKGSRKCSTSSGCGHPLGGLLGCECGADEVALQPPPGWLATKFLVQQPYPVLDEEKEDRIVCFGP